MEHGLGSLIGLINLTDLSQLPLFPLWRKFCRVLARVYVKLCFCAAGWTGLLQELLIGYTLDRFSWQIVTTADGDVDFLLPWLRMSTSERQ